MLLPGERQKYAGKKVGLNRGSNSQPQGHESNMLTTEPPRQGEPKLKAFADVKLNIARVFSKAFSLGSLKVGIV